MTVSHKKFKTEVQQLLDLVIHSLYSNRDIFLRELVSNASDAIDRARFESLSNQALLEDDPEWRIRLTVDKQAKTLTVADNGIGMTRAEVEDNIGTIASSGTRRFLEEVRKQDGKVAPELIGQFGVGFYSAFMVADKVTVLTRRAGDKADGIGWVSTGDGTYDIETAPKDKRGTEVTLHLKDDMLQYLEDWSLQKIVVKYSNFVEHPIELQVLDTERKGAQPEPEVINTRKAIWQRPKSEITEDEYKEFYHHVSHDFQDPLETLHWTAEGATEFKGLLYLPQKVGFEFLQPEQQHRGIHLYIKRVFITDNCEELRPGFLRFLRGVVDSADLPLNVSREVLQENKVVRVIRTNLVKKVLDTLAEMKEKNREKYVQFWTEFGRVLKEGMHTEAASREKLQNLLLFQSATTAPGVWLSLEEYVKAMPPGQKAIYYALGEDRAAIANSPHLEAFRSAGFDVLFMSDPIDEWVIQSLPQFQEKPLKAVARGAVDLPADDSRKDETAKEQKLAADEFAGLTAFLKECLKDRTSDVVLSQRLTESACCLVFDEHAPGPQTERIMRAMGHDVPPTKGALELNPKHPLLATMRSLHQVDAQQPKLKEYAELLMDQALLTAGLPVPDLLQFTRRVSALMAAEGQGIAGGPAVASPA